MVNVGQKINNACWMQQPFSTLLSSHAKAYHKKIFWQTQWLKNIALELSCFSGIPHTRPHIAGLWNRVQTGKDLADFIELKLTNWLTMYKCVGNLYNYIRIFQNRTRVDRWVDYIEPAECYAVLDILHSMSIRRNNCPHCYRTCRKSAVIATGVWKRISIPPLGTA